MVLSAIPSEYSAELSTLDASLNELRAAPVSTTSSSPATTAPEVTSKGSTATSSGSKVWIAGAVVGSVAGVALIILGILLYHRRKKMPAQACKKPDPSGHGDYMTGFKPELPSDPPPQPLRIYEMDATKNLSEMAVHERPQELSAEHTTRSAGEPA